MPHHSPTRNQNPEPVRHWFARLFRRRPTAAQTARAALVNADPADISEALVRATGKVRTVPGIPAPISEALAASTRQAEEIAVAALEEASRWRQHADSYERERDGAYRERAQLLSWLAALHPSSTVITASPDVDEDGWQLLYLVAGGWQMSWHIHPRDADLFRHVTVVDVTDPRAQWDGHGTEQKYERMRNHVRLLALEGLVSDSSSADAMGEAHSA